MVTTFLLPPSAYTDDTWYAREQRELFARTWHLVGPLDALRFPGDYVTVSLGSDPVVVVRDLDGELRAHHNFCRHRGHTLLEGTGNVRRGIVCPYHFWGFGLDGELRRVPQREQFAGCDLSAFGLLPASVAEWGGMVFAASAPNADFAQWLGDFDAHIGSYRPAQLVEVAHEQFDARCNWKLFVENHIDVYHLWYLHKRSLGAYDHERFEWAQVGPDGRHWVSYEPTKEGVERKRPHVGSAQIRDLDERDRDGIGAHMIFPNILMATEAEFFMTYVPVPVAPDRCVVDVRVRAEPEADAESLVAAAKNFMLEDIIACERVQAAVGSTKFSVGPLSDPHERPITDFHGRLLEFLDPAG